MSELEQKRLKLEHLKVSTAKAEMEFLIDQRLDEISRLRDNMANQDKRLAEIKDQLAKEGTKL